MSKVICPTYLKGREFDILRDNPDRGWRIETYITLGSSTVMFNKGYTPEEFLDREIMHYKDVPVKTVQVYVYLTEYVKKPLDEKAFSQLKCYLLLLKERKLRALLRFAYEYDVSMRTGPTTQRINSHTEQIKNWMNENEELIKQTVMVIQAGFIGAWGEWHTSKYPHNGKNMLLKICDMCPPYLTVQTRQQRFRDRIKDFPECKKTGFHDDYLVGVYHRWSAMKSGPGTDSFKRFEETSLYTLNDGEMPWGKDTSFNKGHIDGYEMVEGIWLRSLTTMSITHNFTEDGKQFNAYRWMSEKITPEFLDRHKIPCFPSYFENCSKSVFDFITDHLGYMTGIEKIEVNENEISLTIKNSGFALPYGFSSLEIFIDNGREIKKYSDGNFNYNLLIRGKTAEYKIKADTENIKRAGIRLTKPIKDFPSIRFANICEYKDGINWFNI